MLSKGEKMIDLDMIVYRTMKWVDKNWKGVLAYIILTGGMIIGILIGMMI